MNPVWTHTNQRELERLQLAKHEFVTWARAPVAALAKSMLGEVEVSVTDLTDFMINHADSLRDALAPFDSGVRPK